MFILTGTASASPPGYNLYMFGRIIRQIMFDNSKEIGLETDRLPNFVEIIWDTSEISNKFCVWHGNMNLFKCHCSHNRREFSDLLKANSESKEICDRFDSKGKYSVFVGDSNFLMSLVMDGNDDFKPIEVKLARKQE